MSRPRLTGRRRTPAREGNITLRIGEQAFFETTDAMTLRDESTGVRYLSLQTIRYSVSFNPWDLEQLARKASCNKRGQSQAGPLFVKAQKIDEPRRAGDVEWPS
jgi:hypothetical protein